MTSTIRSGQRLDRLAELEEERRFLLRSLQDLEREHAAGDVDDDDYVTLKDGYTVRAATVLREIEAGKRQLAPRRPRRWGVVALVGLAVVAAAAAIGLVLAQAWGERGANQEITGFTPGDDVRAVLTSARSAYNDGDLPLANELYFSVVQSERDRGVANAEALTYYGWTLALGTINNPDRAEAEPQLDLAVLVLAEAVAIDPDYADPHCFLAIVEGELRDDPATARPHLDACEANNPPADVAGLVAEFAPDLRAG